MRSQREGRGPRRASTAARASTARPRDHAARARAPGGEGARRQPVPSVSSVLVSLRRPPARGRGPSGPRRYVPRRAVRVRCVCVCDASRRGAAGPRRGGPERGRPPPGPGAALGGSWETERSLRRVVARLVDGPGGREKSSNTDGGRETLWRAARRERRPRWWSACMCEIQTALRHSKGGVGEGGAFEHQGRAPGAACWPGHGPP